MPQFVITLDARQPRVHEYVNTRMLMDSKLLLLRSCAPVVAVDSKHASGEKAKSIYINVDSDYYPVANRRGTQRDDKTYFIKNAHSNEWVNLEILSAKLAALTGISVPWTIFAQGFENSPYFSGKIVKRVDNHNRGQFPAYFVASQRLKGFRDVSNIPEFVNDYKEYLIEVENHQEFDKAYNALISLARDQFQNVADYKMARRDAYYNVYKFFPTQMKDMLEELYIVSAWLGNWDFLNFDMENVGITLIHKGHQLIVEPAIVDFGNCLFAGFSGKHKEDSLEVANSPAKKTETHKKDEDPELDEAHKIEREVAGFGNNPETIRLKNIPRRLPFEPFVKTLDEKLEKIQDPNNQEKVSLSKGAMRGLYRLSKISDEAIDKVLDKWFLLGQQVNYCYPEKNNYTSEDLANILKARRDKIVELFDHQIQKYESKHKADSIITDKEIRNATIDVASFDPAKEIHKPITGVFSRAMGG